MFINFNNGNNVITDGVNTCSYLEILDFFENIQKLLSKNNITTNDCLALECDNLLPSTLTILYLLEKDRSILLLPKASNKVKETCRNFLIPKFCRYIIRTKHLTSNKNNINIKYPAQFLQITENERWVKNEQHTNNSQRKLYLQTSGSTGHPKTVVHSHTKLRKNVLNCVKRLELQGNDKITIPVPVFHMYGLGAAFLPGVAVGASIDLQKSSNLLRYLQREKEFNPNISFLTPIFCETLLKGRKSSREYKLTVVAGDRVRKDTFALYESRMGCLVKLYGSTEMGAIAAASPEESREVRSQTVGKPMSGVQIRLEENTLEAAKGKVEVGELWCRHEYGFEGYVDENGNSASQGMQADWFRTKDLGHIREDGYVEVFGRCDHSVNRDGLLVLFSDVEKAIESIEGIESVVVVSKGESQRGKGLVAYCVLVKNSEITEADIRSACFERLPGRAIPDVIRLIKSLPTLPNGKVDTQKLISMDDKLSPSQFIQINQ